MTVKIHFMIVYWMHNAIPFFRVCKLCARSFVLDSVGSVDAVWCLNSRKRRDEKNITKWHVCFAFIHRIYSISRCELGFVCFSLNAKEWTMNETIHEMLSFCMFQISFLLSRALSWVFQRRHLRVPLLFSHQSSSLLPLSSSFVVITSFAPHTWITRQNEVDLLRLLVADSSLTLSSSASLLHRLFTVGWAIIFNENNICTHSFHLNWNKDSGKRCDRSRILWHPGTFTILVLVLFHFIFFFCRSNCEQLELRAAITQTTKCQLCAAVVATSTVWMKRKTLHSRARFCKMT